MADGDCYQANANKICEVFMDYKDNEQVLSKFKLVHGRVQGAKGSKVEGKWFGHAWIEQDAQVIIDFSNGKSFGGRLEEIEYRIDRSTCKYYSPKEVAELLLIHEHYGPWD